MLVVVAAFGQENLGREGPQDYDYQEYMMNPITKWRWMAQTADGIPEPTRRALKFDSTPPCGPVFLAIPDNELRTVAKSTIMDQALFDVSMKVRPDKDAVEKAAKMLIEAGIEEAGAFAAWAPVCCSKVASPSCWRVFTTMTVGFAPGATESARGPHRQGPSRPASVGAGDAPGRDDGPARGPGGGRLPAAGRPAGPALRRGGSGSGGSRGRCRSACRCGAAPSGRTAAFTTTWTAR